MPTFKANELQTKLFNEVKTHVTNSQLPDEVMANWFKEVKPILEKLAAIANKGLRAYGQGTEAVIAVVQAGIEELDPNEKHWIRRLRCLRYLVSKEVLKTTSCQKQLRKLATLTEGL